MNIGDKTMAKNKKVATLDIHVNYKKVPNKMHLQAQIMYPHLITKDKTKYDRKQIKKQIRQEQE